MLNFLGLGLSLVGRDDGMSKAAEGARGAIMRLRDSITGIATLGSDVHDITTRNRELTTGFEHEMQLADKTAKKVAYAANLTEEQGKRVRSLTKSIVNGTGLSADAAASASSAFVQMGDDLKAALNIKDAATLAKTLDTLGANGEDVNQVFREMGKQLGLNVKEQAEMVNGFVAAARAGLDPSAGIPAVANAAKQLQEWNLAAMEPISASALKERGLQMARLAGVMGTMGTKASVAFSASSQLMEVLVKNKKEYQSLFVTGEGSIGKVAEEMSILSGSLPEAMKLMEEGPQGIALGLSKLFQTIDDAAISDQEKADSKQKLLGAARARLAMTGLSDEGIQEVLRLSKVGFNDLQKKLAAQQNASADAFRDASKPYVDPRSLDQILKLQEEMVRAHFRSLAGNVGQEYAKSVSAAVGETGKVLTAVAQDKTSGMGAFLGRLAEIDKIGENAFLPKRWRGYAATIGMYGKAMEKSITLFLNPLSLAEMGFTSLGSAILESFNKAKLSGATNAEALKQGLVGGINNFLDYLVTVPDTIMSSLESIFDSIADTFSGGAGKKIKGKTLGEWASSWWEKLFGVGDAQGQGKGFFPKINDILRRIGTFFSGVWEGVTKGFNPNEQVADKARGAGRNVGAMLGKLWDSVTEVWNKDIWPSIQSFFSVFWDTLVNGADPEVASKGVKKPGAGIIGGNIAQFIKNIWTTADKWLKDNHFWDNINKFVADFKNSFTNGLNPNAFTGKEGIGADLGLHLKRIVEIAQGYGEQAIDKMFLKIRTNLRTNMGAIGSAIDAAMGGDSSFNRLQASSSVDVMAEANRRFDVGQTNLNTSRFNEAEGDRQRTASQLEALRRERADLQAELLSGGGAMDPVAVEQRLVQVVDAVEGLEKHLASIANSSQATAEEMEKANQPGPVFTPGVAGATPAVKKGKRAGRPSAPGMTPGNGRG